MNSKYKYKLCMMDSIFLIGIIQLFRSFINKILLSQLNLNLLNAQIINMISCMIVCISLSLILKNNELYSPVGHKLIIMTNTKITLPKIILLGILTVLIVINPNFNGGYIISNIIPLVTSTIIIPILEELLFREYLWNYFKNYVRNRFKIFIGITILYGIYYIGYIDIIHRELTLVNQSAYTLNLILYGVVRYLVLGSILGFIKIKFKDTQICILVHSLINVIKL